MKRLSLCLFLLSLWACSQSVFQSNGESIYRLGQNLAGQKLLDRRNSRIGFADNCRLCHGKYGTTIRQHSIRFSDLANPQKYDPPYTDSLFFRFLDSDIKSNGENANIGVIWKMSDADKVDLLEYLKQL